MIGFISAAKTSMDFLHLWIFSLPNLSKALLTDFALMKAVIMAGGEGTRLRPLTSNQPKPMLPMANIPMMEHVVNLLRRHGFEDIVVTVAFMANARRWAY